MALNFTKVIVMGIIKFLDLNEDIHVIDPKMLRASSAGARGGPAMDGKLLRKPIPNDTS
jgi:hypothetical protein